MPGVVESAAETRPLHVWASRWRYRLLRFRNRFPHLVWRGDQVDVCVTFSEARLTPVEFNPDEPGAMSAVLSQLDTGHLAKVEAALREIGITFDKGVGMGGRDWEWDFSLKGPISVRFKRRAERPELRQ